MLEYLIELALIFGLLRVVYFFDRKRLRLALAKQQAGCCGRCGIALRADSTALIIVSGYYAQTSARACPACASRDWWISKLSCSFRLPISL